MPPAAIPAPTVFVFSTQANAAASPKAVLPLLPSLLRLSVSGTRATKSLIFSNRISSMSRALVIDSWTSGLPAVPAAADTEVDASSASDALTVTLPDCFTSPPSEAFIVVLVIDTAMPAEATPSLNEPPLADTSCDFSPVASTSRLPALSITAPLPTSASAD